MIPGATLRHVQGKTVYYQQGGFDEQLPDVDSVIFALAGRANNGLQAALADIVDDVRQVADGLSLRHALEAIWHGQQAGWEVKCMSAAELIQTFLRTMEARDLDAAEAMMAKGALIVFPGGKVFSSQREMVESAQGRYQWVKKTFDQIDHAVRDDGSELVYILGTLHGVNKHGVPFDGIRYIDRFIVRDGKIAEQHVWNDLAESGVLERTAKGEPA